VQEIELFAGNCLRGQVAQSEPGITRCQLQGEDSSGRPATLAITDELLSKHLLFLGGIGTGKTNAIFHLTRGIRESLTAQDVLIIFDAKGDFRQEFYTPGDVVISNDRTATGSTGADYWNIFSELQCSDSEHLEENIVEIAKSFFMEEIRKEHQPFFPRAAKDVFAAILRHFCRSGLTANNHSLRDYLSATTIGDLRSMLSSHSDLRAIGSYIEGNNAQSQGVMSSIEELAQEIFLGNFRKVGTLSMRQLVRDKGARVIFIEYDLGIGNMLAPIYRVLFDLAIKEALSRDKSEGNVYFIADEFRLIPALQHVDNAVNFGRSLGVKFIIGNQNIEQLYHIYGPNLARSILSGFSTSVNFRLNDYQTRGYVKGLFGQNLTINRFSSVSPPHRPHEQIRESNVVEDWDLSRLERGEAIIGLPGVEPFIFKFMPYKSGKVGDS
jgi:type IV secretory pathway TraG/TraD family ATPase VirD4